MGATRVAPASSGWLLEGLAADGSYAEYADKLSMFGQFVGDRTIVECRNLE